MPVALRRLVVRLDGWPGAPGFMTFYSVDETLMQPAVKAFINAVKINFPQVVTITVPAEGDIIDDTTGNLTGAWSSGTALNTTGGTAGAFAAPVGACIAWSTASIVTGAAGTPRRLRGRTFLVPLHPVVFEGDGTITAATLTALRNAASTLWSSGLLYIWHRPYAGAPSGGSAHPVSGSDVKDRAAVLRSRRS